MPSDFFICFKRYLQLSDKGVDMFIKSWKYPKESEERQILELKKKLYDRESKKQLDLLIQICEKKMNSMKH